MLLVIVLTGTGSLLCSVYVDGYIWFELPSIIRQTRVLTIYIVCSMRPYESEVFA